MLRYFFYGFGLVMLVFIVGMIVFSGLTMVVVDALRTLGYIKGPTSFSTVVHSVFWFMIALICLGAYHGFRDGR